MPDSVHSEMYCIKAEEKMKNHYNRIGGIIIKIVNNRIFKKLLAVLLVCSLMPSFLLRRDVSAQQDTATVSGYGYSNPVTENGITTWDCLYFGSYWQNDTNNDGEVDESDDKQPIKWRVLSVEGNDVFLLADRNLYKTAYNLPYASEDAGTVKWESSTVRSWLNGYSGEANICNLDYTDDNFLNTAFSDLEQAAIKDTLVVNDYNTTAYPDGGNNTTDKIYLLSAPEIMQASYGFVSTWNKSQMREAKNTAYIDSGENKGDWWLRTLAVVSSISVKACYIDAEGRLWRSDGAANVGDLGCAVRPALHLDLAALDDESNFVWSYAGKITSDGREIEAELPKPEVTTENPEPEVTTENPEPEVTTENPKPEVTTEPPASDATTQASDSPNIIPVKVSNITVSGTTKKLAKGKKMKLKLSVEPIDAINRNVVWSCSNPDVASVDSYGTVSAKAAGRAVITATAADGSGVSGSYAITVVKHTVQKIIIKAEKKKVTAGKKVKVNTTIKTSGKTANKVLEWTTSNQKYATVNSKGVVTTKKAGKGKTVTITAKATDGSGKKDSIKIKIK